MLVKETAIKLQNIINDIEIKEKKNTLTFLDLEEISKKNNITILKVMEISKKRVKYKEAINLVLKNN